MVEYCFDEESDAVYSQKFIDELMDMCSLYDPLNHINYMFNECLDKGRLSMVESTNIGLALLIAIRMKYIKPALKSLKEENNRLFGLNKVKLEIDEGSIFNFALVLVRPRGFKIRKRETSCA
jgi:hypothetical protein